MWSITSIIIRIRIDIIIIIRIIIIRYNNSNVCISFSWIRFVSDSLAKCLWTQYQTTDMLLLLLALFCTTARYSLLSFSDILHYNSTLWFIGISFISSTKRFSPSSLPHLLPGRKCETISIVIWFHMGFRLLYAKRDLSPPPPVLHPAFGSKPLPPLYGTILICNFSFTL